MLHCGNNTECIVTGLCIFLNLLYVLGHKHMKTLKNLWAGNVEDENEGSVFFYLMNQIQRNIRCDNF